MSEWWKKLMGILRGEEFDPLGGGATKGEPTGHADPHAAGVVSRQAPRSSVTMPTEELRIHSRSAPQDPAFPAPWAAQISDRLERLSGLVEHQSGGSGRAENDRLIELVESLERRLAARVMVDQELSALLRRVTEQLDSQKSGGSNGHLEVVIEKTTAAEENIQRIREIVATLPEIVQTQLEALNGLHERLNPLAASVDGAVGTLDRSAASYGEIKTSVGTITESLTRVARADAELGARQQLIAKALNVLRQQGVDNGEAIVEVSEELSQAKGELNAQIQEVRKHVGRQTGRLRSASTMAIVFSIIAALASLAALVRPMLFK